MARHARTRVKRLVSEIFKAERLKSELSDDKFKDRSIIEIQIPDWMKPILDILPRQTKAPSAINISGDSFLPLTEDSLILIIILFTISKDRAMSSLDALFAENASLAKYEIRKKFFAAKCREILKLLDLLIKKLGFKEKKVVKQLKQSDWCPAFRTQWDHYAKFVIEGPHVHKELSKLIDQYEINLGVINENSLGKYLSSLEIGLYYCQLPAQWKLEDLLSFQALHQKSVILSSIGATHC
jgi:hypothetical protein